MRVHRALDEVLRGKGTLHVLRTLCHHPQTSFNAPQLARIGKVSLSHVQSALVTLEGQGLVFRTVAGRSHQWSIERRNALLPALRALFDAEGRLDEGLFGDLEDGLRAAPIRRAVVFGSVARGDERGSSDVDLLVEMKTEGDREKVWDFLLPLSSKIRERYGLNLAPILLSPSSRRGSMSPSFLAAIDREGRTVGGAA
jgi:predicted nucleotidyltransferase/DNA-binding HxlR family transcriptional regulator